MGILIVSIAYKYLISSVKTDGNMPVMYRDVCNIQNGTLLILFNAFSTLTSITLSRKSLIMI